MIMMQNWNDYYDDDDDDGIRYTEVLYYLLEYYIIMYTNILL